MKISFLVTYYQQERFVRESMDSILALAKPCDWEILIGDDGSTDGTIAAARAYAEQDPERIHLYIMDREPGKKYMSVARASANRLNLLAHASGDYYCLMDGDDFYSETDFLSSALDVLESRPEVSVVGFDTWMYRDGQPERRKPGGSGKPVSVSRSRYLRWQYTHAGACVFRRTGSADRLAFLRELGSFDDNDIVLNALSFGEIVRIHRPVYAYRQAEGSVYTEMNPAERASLNVWGMGVACRIMGPEWEREIMARYATAVWMAWFLRKDLQSMLDPVRYAFYLDGCRRMDFEKGVSLLRYPELSPRERCETRKWVFRTGLASPPRVFYAWIQTRGRRKKA